VTDELQLVVYPVMRERENVEINCVYMDRVREFESNQLKIPKITFMDTIKKIGDMDNTHSIVRVDSDGGRSVNRENVECQLYQVPQKPQKKFRYNMDQRSSREEAGKNTEQAGEASGDMGQAATSVPPRLYECVFCKGGFTSAQALGGHMNVHRRERARLRQSLSSTLSAPYDLRQRHPAPSSLATQSGQAPSSSSLAPQSATTPGREKYSSEPGSSKTRKERAQDDEELDLELRLGEKPLKK
ncbi:hypothetical protein KI387_005145, partial [Taxus chinensis]